MALTVDQERSFKEVKLIFRRVCDRANCPSDNDALNRITEFLVLTCAQEEEDPVEHAQEFAVMISDPDDNLGAVVARRLFFERATAGRFSGG